MHPRRCPRMAPSPPSRSRRTFLLVGEVWRIFGQLIAGGLAVLLLLIAITVLVLGGPPVVAAACTVVSAVAGIAAKRPSTEDR